MKVLVVVDGHLGKTPDGKIWSSHIYDYNFFARYLNEFDEVRVAIRIHDIDSNEHYPNLCSGPSVEFFPIEEFKGPKEYIKKYFSIRKNINKYFEDCSCAIFRIPSTVGYQFMNSFKKENKPYAIEVVVDPWDFASPGTLKTCLRPIIRLVWTYSLKRACKKANGVSYVTKYALQDRYPSKSKIQGESKQYFESYYSSVNIPVSYFGQEKKLNKNKKELKIIHVTNFIGNYVKGHKELIEAVSILNKKGIKINVDFIGEGNLIKEFEEYSQKLEVKDNINFIGKISDKNLLREKLIESDLFVFPSHAEGLPRVLIEAMAVGLPCISTNVNGIPELLESDYLVEVGDVQSIADKIEIFYNNYNLINIESKNNINKAYNYSEEELQKRRDGFYMKLRSLV